MQQAVTPSPAQGNDKIGCLVQQIVVKQQICRLAFPHDLVPQLQVIASEAFAGLALEVIFKAILYAAMHLGTLRNNLQEMVVGRHRLQALDLVKHRAAVVAC